MNSIGSVQRAQIRRYAASPQTITMGAAVQTVNIEFETVKPTKMIAFGALSVTTVPANDPLTAAWITQIQIIVNQTEYIVPNMSRADYINMVQNFEMKEADVISGAGNMLYKRFDPALPEGTKVQIQLIVNTLALGTTTPAATATLTPICLAFDSLSSGQKKLTYYTPFPISPAVAGVVAGTDIAIALGSYARIEKAILLISESPLGTPVDTWLGRLQLRADGQTVIDLIEPEMKKQYSIQSDGLAIPVGHNLLICPEGGFQAAANSQLQLLLTPYFTTATGQVRGYEIFEKAY